jgi:hypothetical protein
LRSTTGATADWLLAGSAGGVGGAAAAGAVGAVVRVVTVLLVVVRTGDAAGRVGRVVRVDVDVRCVVAVVLLLSALVGFAVASTGGVVASFDVGGLASAGDGLVLVVGDVGVVGTS